MKKFSPYNLLRSFRYAARGVYHALTRERNLRIHFTAGAFAVYFGRYFSLDRSEWGLLTLCIGFVIACEMMNTAIENTVDLETNQYHRLARVAKDVAAGAVLIAAITSIVVGFLLFWDPPVIQAVWEAQVAPRLLLWIVITAAAVGWIVLPQKDDRRKRDDSRERRKKT